MEEIQLRTIQEVIAGASPYMDELEEKYNDNKYWFDRDEAMRYIKFIALLKHTDGNIAGKNFQLINYQYTFIGTIFGVKKRSNNKRRFRTALLFIPKKNGKSQLVSAILVAMLFLMKQRGAEYYCGASESSQAQIVYNASQAMINGAGEFLSSKVQMYASTKTIMEKLNKADKSSGFNPAILKVLTSSVNTKDGLKPLVGVMDELHAHKDGGLYKIIEDGMVSQDEPLMIIPTTAGYNLMGVGKEKYDYAKKVASGVIKDETFFSMIFEVPKEKWEQEEYWVTANPALGYGVKIDGLRVAYQKALNSADDKTSFLTKHCNMWVGSQVEFLADEVWVDNMGELPSDEYLSKLPAYAGLDLSSVSDLTAFVIIFIDTDKIIIKPTFYLPKDRIREKMRSDEVNYMEWVERGNLKLTDGNVVDYDFLQVDIQNAFAKYKIKHCGFDRWNSSSLVTKLLENRINMIGFGQGYASMSPAIKQIEKIALERKFLSDCEMLRWNINNVIIVKDPAENVKFDKSKVKYRIDGAVALAISIGMYIPDMRVASAYADRGIRSL